MAACSRTQLVVLGTLCWASLGSALDLEFRILEPSDAVLRPNQNFGWDVDEAPGLVLVGTPRLYDERVFDATGGAYVFERQGGGWHESRLVPSDAEDGDLIGNSVAILGDRLLVGSYHHDGFGPSSGAVWVYRREPGGWVEEDALFGSDASDGARFGFTLEADAGRVLIGAYQTDGAAGEESGAVYVFRPEGGVWQEVQKLVPSDLQEFDRFGRGIGLSGDVAVIGSSAEWQPSTSGVVYVFRHDGVEWREETRIAPPVPGSRGRGFGESDTIAVSGDRILLGAPWDRTLGTNAGAAYVFRYDGSEWVEEARLLASDGVADDAFGAKTALSGDLALVSKRADNPDGSRGSVYLFRFDGSGWVEESKLALPDRYPLDSVATRLLLRPGRAVIGGDERVYLADVFEKARIDLWPQTEPDVLDPTSPLPVQVALFGSPGLVVGDVVWSSLRFGPAGVGPKLDFPLAHRDRDRDGFRDGVALFPQRGSGVAFGDTEVCVAGETGGGLPFRGCDAIQTASRCGHGGFEAALLVPAVVLLRRSGRRCSGRGSGPKSRPRPADAEGSPDTKEAVT